MKWSLIALLFLSSYVGAQNLTPEEQKQLLREVQDLKGRVNQLENKDSGQGFKTTDYNEKTTAASPSSSAPAEPQMTEEQRAEIMATIDKYKKAQVEQEKALKELEDEE